MTSVSVRTVLEVNCETHFFDLEDITRNDFWSLNLLKLAVTEDSGLESKSLLQLLDDGASLEFLDETDASVEQKQGADDTEVDPILETGSKNGSSLSDG